MSRRITFAHAEWYHLYNRGTEKRRIFSSEQDYRRFLSLLYLCNTRESTHVAIQGRSGKGVFDIPQGEPLIEIGAHCLMPNHFHLLVREKQEKGIGLFMQKLLTGYTMYFNIKYERSGTLFQGKYKATHAGDDRYLKYLIAYIHLNPAKLAEPRWKEKLAAERNVRKIERFLDTYQYSSYLDYMSMIRAEKKILAMNSLPRYWDSSAAFKAGILEWLTDEPSPVQGPTS